MHLPLQFNGSRLAEARTARAFSQSQLGEKSGVSKQSISYYENGKQTPRAESIEKLAHALNVPPAYFFAQDVSEEVAPIYFRSLTKLQKSERARATSLLGWLARLLYCYQQYLDLVPVNIPTHLDASDRYAKLSDVNIENLATQCRRHFGMGDGPISNLALLLENNGIIIVRIPLNLKAEDAFSRWTLSNSIPVAVMVSDLQDRGCRDRFSLAHELGHLVMHRHVHPTSDNIKLIEKQANRFASAFLMPSNSYTRDFGYPSLDVFRFLKEKWKVSIQAQIMRCKQLGIISAGSSKRFFINISKRGWRINEPLDDIIPPENLKALKEATKLLYDQGGMTPDSLSHETSLSVEDIELLTGVRTNPVKESLRAKLKVTNGGNKVIPFPKKY